MEFLDARDEKKWHGSRVGKVGECERERKRRERPERSRSLFSLSLLSFFFLLRFFIILQKGGSSFQGGRGDKYKSIEPAKQRGREERIRKSFFPSVSSSKGSPGCCGSGSRRRRRTAASSSSPAARSVAASPTPALLAPDPVQDPPKDALLELLVVG